MNLISIFGAGLLVGAALIVIVPEGMMVLYKALSNIEIEDSEEKENMKQGPNGRNSTNRMPENSVDPDIDKYVGASLIIGFASMLIMD